MPGETKVYLPDNEPIFIPDDIADDDQSLRDSLSTYVPEIRNAELKRFKEGEQKCVRVVKKAGTKGGRDSVLEKLIHAKEEINPAVELHQRMLEMDVKGELTSKQLLLMTGEIEKTIELSGNYERAMKESLAALKESEAVADKRVPAGF
jgi:hypothetical protein